MTQAVRAALTLVLLGLPSRPAAPAAALPVAPRSHSPSAASSRAATKESAVFAGGCFWGVESVFDHVRGVRSAISGYATPAPGAAGAIQPRLTSAAEAVSVVYDPNQVTYAQLLQIFFLVVHDPTQLDRQGPDEGPQYRSMVFPQDDTQRREVEVYLDELRTSGIFAQPIVTEIVQLRRFRQAEEDHQDYAAHHPDQAYIRINDAPKLMELRRRFPSLYRD